jgi:DNA polymerase-3 subunit alpha
VYRSKEDRVTAFIEECRRQGISVLPPDVNLSGVDFTIEEQMPVHKNGKNGKKPPAPVKTIRFGLAAIKGVGEGIVESLIQERAEKPFTHLYEFCERIKPYGMNRAALDALIKSGALDCIDRNRKKLLEFAEPAMTFADNALRNRQAGQDSLFGGSDDTSSTTHYPALPEQPALTRSEALAFEKEVLGIYVSDHPLRGYEQAIRRAATHRCDSISELDEGTNVKLAGLIANTRAITTKRGDKMATLVLEDLSGQAGCTLFAATYAKLRDLVEKDKVVSLSGVVTYRDRTINGGERTVEVRVEDIQLIDPSQEISMDDDDETVGTLVIRVQKATTDQLVGLRQLIEQTPGEYGVVIQLGDGEGILPIQLLRRVDAGPEFRTKALRAVAQCEMELIKKVSLVGSVADRDVGND